MTTACSIDAVFCPPIADALARVLGGSTTLLEDKLSDDEDDSTDDPYAHLTVEEKWARMEADYANKDRDGASTVAGAEGADKAASQDSDDDEGGGLDDGVAVAHTLAYKACVCHELWANGRGWDAQTIMESPTTTADNAVSAAHLMAQYPSTAAHTKAIKLASIPPGVAARALSVSIGTRRRRLSKASLGEDERDHVTPELRHARLESLDSCYRSAILALDIAQEWDVAKHMCRRLREMYEREAAIQADMSGALFRGNRSVRSNTSSGGRAVQRDAVHLAESFRLQLAEIKVLEEKISADNHTKPHLVPLYCAVHFTGRSFPLIERGNWFIYRLQEATHSAALVHTLQERYPFAQVFGPRYPLVVSKPAAAATGGVGAGAGWDAASTSGGSQADAGSTGAGSGPASTSAGRSATVGGGSMQFLGVPADPTSPTDDHIYVYPALLVSSGTVTKEVVDRNGVPREVSMPGSRFRVWVARAAAELGVKSLNVAPTTPNAPAAVNGKASAGDPSFTVSDLGPCLLNTYGCTCVAGSKLGGWHRGLTTCWRGRVPMMRTGMTRRKTLMRCWANRTTRRCALSICSSRTSKSAVLASVPAHLATRPSTCFYICSTCHGHTDEFFSFVFALPAINRCMSRPTCRGSRGAVRSHARSSSPRPSRPPASTGCRRTVTCWPIVFGGCTTPRCTRANPPSVARQVKSAAARTPSETCLTRRNPGRQMRTSTCLRTLCRRWQLVARPVPL